MNYQIDYSDEARKALRTLPGYYRQQVRRIIEGLGQTPRPANANELRDRPGYFRIRLDDWRIIYQVNGEDALVFIPAVRRKTGPETYSDI